MEPTPPPLNLLAFPSLTTGRLLLLIIAILSATAFVFSELYLAIPMHQAQIAQIAQQCTDKAVAVAPYDIVLQLEIFLACLHSFQREQGLWMIGGMVAVLALAGVFYWVAPSVEIKRNHLIPLDRDIPDETELVIELESMSQSIGVNPPPTFLFVLSDVVDGRSFGRIGRYFVVVTAALLNNLSMPHHRAIILHELAHIHNGDVDKTTYTRAILPAFGLVIAIPLMLILWFQEGVPTWEFSWRLLVLGGLIYLIQAGVIRDREFYADAGAARIKGMVDPLRQDLSKAARDPLWNVPPLQHFNKWVQFQWQHRFHPHPQHRLNVLNEPYLLWNSGIWDAFVCGVLLSFALHMTIALLYLALPFIFYLLAILFAVIGLMGIVFGILGAKVWGASVAEATQGYRPSSRTLMGISLGLGIILGQYTTLPNIALSRSSGMLPSGALVVFDSIWAFAILSSSIATIFWLNRTLKQFAPAAGTTPSRLRVLQLLGTLPFLWLVWFAIWFGLWYLRATAATFSAEIIVEDLNRFLHSYPQWETLGISFTIEWIWTFLAVVLILVFVVVPGTLLFFIGLWLMPLITRHFYRHGFPRQGPS